MEPILKFENVSKDYPNGVHALKNVSSVSYTHLTLPTIA